MVVDIAPVGFVGRRPHLDFGAILEPYIHPLAYGVLLGPDGVHLGVFLDGPLQFLLAVFLGFGEDIFVDHFASVRVAARCVAALPASVAALTDVALSVSPTLTHVPHLPLRNF